MSGAGGELDALRPVSFGIAYRMLGSVAEAEDIVQEALLRVHRAQYVGEWLPEPIFTGGDPGERLETLETLSMAMLVLLEALSPEQRAALLLHDVFDYGYREIGGIIGKSEENARQLAARARRQVMARRPRFQPSDKQREDLARQFFAAVEQGDLAGLERLLAEDVVMTGDGGGKAPALARSSQGRDAAVRILGSWLRVAPRLPKLGWHAREVNGSPGGVLLDGEGRLVSVMSFDFDGDRIASIQVVSNPDKLGRLGPLGDLRAIMAAMSR